MLQTRSELFWPQLFNRLQWVDGPVLELIAAEQERRRASGTDTILKMRTPVHESEALIATFMAGPVHLHGVAVSPDRTVIAACSSDATVRLWDIALGMEMRPLTGHACPVTACAFAPDGSMVVSGDDAGTVKLWNMPEGSERVGFSASAGPINDLAMSPDGSFFVSAGADGMLVRWDTKSGKDVRMLGHRGAILGCAIHPHASLIASASADCTVKVWDACTGEERVTITGHNGPVHACVFSPDGELLASASSDSNLRRWRLTSDGPLQEGADIVTDHAATLLGCAYSPDGSLIASASGDGTVKLWCMPAWDERAPLVGHTARASGVHIDVDGSKIASSALDGSVKLWWAERAVNEPLDPGTHKDWIGARCLSSDGRWVLSVGESSALSVWNSLTGRVRATLDGLADRRSAFSFDPSGEFVVAGMEDGSVRLWDAQSGRHMMTLVGHNAPVLTCAVSPDASYIVSAGRDQQVRVWDPHSGTALASLIGHVEPVHQVLVSPSGTQILSVSLDGAKAWDPVGGEKFRLDEHDGGIVDCAYSADESSIVTAGRDRTLRSWDATNGQLLFTVSTELVAGTCAIGAHGTRVVGGFADGLFKLWDLQHGVQASLALAGEIWSVAMRGSVLVCAARGGLYDLDLLHDPLAGEPATVTGVDFHDGNGLVVRCPHCNKTSPFQQEWRGQDIACPQEGCGGPLRVNKFIVGEAALDTR